MTFHKVFLLCTYFIQAYYGLVIGSAGITIPTDHELYPFRLSTITSRSKSIILDVEDDDSTMKTSIIKNCYDDSQAVIIFTRHNAYMNSTKDAIGALINCYTNYIILMNNLQIHLLNDPIMNILKLKWSYHHIIITTSNPEYKCYKAGVINEELLIKIESFLNDVWHKFRIVYVSLSLPYDCPGILFIYDKKKSSGRPLYNRTIRMVTTLAQMTSTRMQETSRYLSEGYPLRANIFHRFPTAIRDCKNLKYYMIPQTQFSQGFCGLDGIIMANIVKHFQFNLSLSGSKNFGYVKKDGRAIGALGNVLRGEVDISFSSRFMVPYALHGVSFLDAIWEDCLCIFEKRPSDRPVWLFPAEAYQQKVWLIVIPMLALIGWVTWVSSVIMKKHVCDRKLKMQSLSFHIWDSILSGCLGIFTGKKPTCYFLKALCLNYYLIHVSTFQGHVNYVFTTRIHNSEIQTLKEVHDVGMKVYVTPAARHLIEPPYNEIQEEIFRDNLYLRPVTETHGLEMALRFENIGSVSRRSDGILETLLSFSNTKNEPLLTIVKECFRCYSAAYICTEGFLFEEALKLFIEHTIEAGLPNKYYTWTRLGLLSRDNFKIKGKQPRPASKIKLTDLRIGFALLLTGYAISFIVYLHELYSARKYGIAE